MREISWEAENTDAILMIHDWRFRWFRGKALGIGQPKSMSWSWMSNVKGNILKNESKWLPMDDHLQMPRGKTVIQNRWRKKLLKPDQNWHRKRMRKQFEKPEIFLGRKEEKRTTFFFFNFFILFYHHQVQKDKHAKLAREWMIYFQLWFLFWRHSRSGFDSKKILFNQFLRRQALSEKRKTPGNNSKK